MEGRRYPCSGFETVQGRRWNMEDAHLNIDSLQSVVKDAPASLSLYAVFDGHGGKRAAIYAEEKFVEVFCSQKAFKSGNYTTAFAATYEQLDKELISMLTTSAPSLTASTAALAAAAAAAAIEDELPPTAGSLDGPGPPPAGGNDGSTVLTILVDGQTLYVANAGDSEAVLARRRDIDGKPGNTELKAMLLSKKHTPHDEDERKRLESAGATVQFNRVNGVLAVSRGFGDKEFKSPFNRKDVDWVLCAPFLQTVPLTAADEFMILACDGVWDTISYDRAVEIVHSARWNGASPMQAAEKLTTEALDTRSTDNITCLVVYLNDMPGKRK